MVTCRSRIFVNLVSQWSRFFCVLSIEQLGSHAFVGKFWLLAIDFVSSLRRQIWNLQICWLVSFGVYRCLPGALLSFTHGAWWIFIVRSVWKTWQGVLILFSLGSAEGKLVGSPYERDCYFGVPQESQPTNPNHQFTLSWWVLHFFWGYICPKSCFFCISAEVLRYPATVTPRSMKMTS